MRWRFFYIIHRIPKFVLVISTVAVIVILGWLIVQAIHGVPVNELSGYINLILAALTLALVMVTAFYAWVTYRMLNEMVQTRRSEISPSISFRFKLAEISQEPLGSKADTHRVIIKTVLQLANYGRGPAINMNVLIGMDLSDDPTVSMTTISPNFESSMPIILEPGNELKGETVIIGRTTIPNILVGRKGEFTFYSTDSKVEILFEDKESNLYSLVQWYRLGGATRIGSDENYNEYRWELREESLFFVSFNRRQLSGSYSEVVHARHNAIDLHVSRLGAVRLIFRRTYP